MNKLFYLILMDLSGLSEAIKESLLVIGYIEIIVGIPSLSLYYLQKIGYKIGTSAELEKVVKEEAINLGMDLSNIDMIFNSNNKGPFKAPAIVQKVNNRYQLILNDKHPTRRFVKHELYHIYKGDLDANSMVRYWLIEEPRATIYSTLGIKI